MQEADNDRTPFASIVDGMTTDALPGGDEVVSVFAIIKSRSASGEIVWSGRSGGAEISSEELLGVFVSLSASLRDDLANEWEW